MADAPEIAGMAALTICEALLLALNDRAVLPEREIVGILRDAAATHAQAAAADAAGSNGGAPTVPHAEVAALIQRIIDGGNSVRRAHEL